MRILQIIHDFVPETVAGAEVIAHNLAVSLAEKGHEVYVFCRGWKLEGEPYAVRDEELDGLHVRRVDFGRAGQTPYYNRHDPAIDQALHDYLTEIQPDLVHIHHMRYLTTNIVAVAKRFGVPVVITMHDMSFRCPIGSRLYHDDTLCYREAGRDCFSCYWPALDSRKRGLLPWKTTNPAMQTLHQNGMGSVLPEVPRQILDSLAGWGEEYNAAYQLADAIHSPSQFLGDMVIEAGIPSERVYVIENGIQYQPGSALPKKPAPRVRFGQIGKSKLKGTHLAVQAMRYLPHDAAELRVYGGISGAYKDELEALAQGANVRLMGSFKQNELPEVFSEIDVLIVPSIWFENCPTVIREAFANNTPVITSNIGGMAEAVRDGVDGLHFNVNDPIDLSRKLQQFIENAELVEQLRSNIKLPPTAELFSQAIERIYLKLVQERIEI